MPDAPNYEDANFALRLYETRRESELRKARAMVGDVLDGAPWETVNAVATWGHKENAHFRQVTSYWDMVASFVARGIFHPDVYLDTCGEGVYLFSVLEEHLERLRKESPRLLKNTEKIIGDHAPLRERLDSINKMRKEYFEQAAAAEAAKKSKKTKKNGAKK